MGNFAGSLGGHFTLHADVYEISVNTGANQSTVRIDLYIQCDSTGTGVFDGSSGSAWGANVNGNAASGHFNYDFRGNNTTIHLATYDTVVTHDASGNATIGWSATGNMNNSPFVTTASISGSLALTHINRVATIPSFTQSATDESIEFDWTSSDNVDYVSWWSVAYDGGGHHDTPSSGTGVFVITLHGLKSETNYDITVAVRRADSGNWTTSSMANISTLKQSNFFGLRVP